MRKSEREKAALPYLARAEAGADGFASSSGRARLRGWSIHPSVEENVVVGKDERRVTYNTERGRVEQANRYVYTENVHRAKRLVFVTALRFAAEPLPPFEWKLSGDPASGEPFTVTLRSGARSRRLRIDLAAPRAEGRVRPR